MYFCLIVDIIILSVPSVPAERLFKHFKVFYGNMYVIKDELGHFEEKRAKIIKIFLSKRSDPDLVLSDLAKSLGSDWIRIHNTEHYYSR
jgi:hypothetical protein